MRWARCLRLHARKERLLILSTFSLERSILNSLRFARIGSMLAIGMLVQACGSLPRLEAVPPTLTEKAAIPGIPNSRYWLDHDLAPFIQAVIQDSKREDAALSKAGKPINPLPPANLLAISGGGDAGAFAAGILTGWSAHGDRPEFKLVTGISAGALIAPFAFLGPQYDDVVVSQRRSVRRTFSTRATRSWASQTTAWRTASR